MSGERVGFRFKHADAVVKRNPQGRSRRGWVMEPVEQTTSRGTKMPAYRIRWRDSERPEIVLQHMLIADPDPTSTEGVGLEPAPKAESKLRPKSRRNCSSSCSASNRAQSCSRMNFAGLLTGSDH